VGIGTVGNAAFGGGNEPSPFAEIYPATTRIHNHPDFRAVALTRGPGNEVILLRSDTVGVFQQLREHVLDELELRIGRDLDDALVIGATHTHSGPGRVLDGGGGPFDLIADTFHPEHYERQVYAMADVVELALADAAPGRLGWTFTRADEGISDRRCEDGVDYVNGTLPVLAAEREGALVALAVAYAMHGTVLGSDDLTLSQDVSGGVEQAIEDRFDHPVMAMMFNSWGADMSPSTPEVSTDSGAVMPGGYDKMERVGVVVADAVEAAIGDVAWEDTPDIALQTHRVTLSIEEIGYGEDEWNYPWGGAFCGLLIEDEDCDPVTTVEGLDSMCVAFPEEFAAPPITLFTAGRIGNTHLMTWPGESGTLLIEGLLQDIAGFDDVGQVAMIGYAQDYTGYSIQEEDWWQGGYEATGALWGPRQGEYLRGEALKAFAISTGRYPQIHEPEALLPFTERTYEAYVGPTPTGFGDVVVPVEAIYSGSEAIVAFTVAGADPWYTAPVAWLETADGDAVLRPNGSPIHSDGQRFWVDLAVDPAYSDGLDVAARAFHWTFSMPLVHVVPSAGPGLAVGSYRLRVVLSDASGSPTEVVSDPFTWEG
jgi:hypothetical protein